MDRPAVEFRMLGPLSVVVGGASLDLGGSKPRLILARLLFEPNRLVATDALLDVLWGEDGAPKRSTLQVHVSNLRKSLGPVSKALGHDPVATRAGGYVLAVPADLVDHLEVDRAVAAADHLVSQGRLADAVESFRRTLDQWHGRALDEFPDSVWADDVAIHFERRRRSIAVALHRVEAEAGELDAAVRGLSDLFRRDPADEEVAALLMVALYRARHQAEALDVFQTCRSHLIEELGLEPSRQMRELEAQIIRQDEALEARLGLVESETTTHVRGSVVLHRAVLSVEGVDHLISSVTTRIGRGTNQDIVIDDLDVSRAHATIRRAASGYLLVDEASTNGTRVNGVPVLEHSLEDGNRIEIGGTTLVFRTSGPP